MEYQNAIFVEYLLVGRAGKEPFGSLPSTGRLPAFGGINHDVIHLIGWIFGEDIISFVMSEMGAEEVGGGQACLRRQEGLYFGQVICLGLTNIDISPVEGGARMEEKDRYGGFCREDIGEKGRRDYERRQESQAAFFSKETRKPIPRPISQPPRPVNCRDEKERDKRCIVIKFNVV